MTSIKFDRLELWCLLDKVLGTREALELFTLLCEIEEKR
jgi:hypothetical protein